MKALRRAPPRADELPDGLHERDLAPWQFKPASEFVFTGVWGQPASAAPEAA